MTTFQKLAWVMCLGFSTQSFAADFSFDRPGAGLGTGITPVGQLAWEQGLPTYRYTEQNILGAKAKTSTLQADMLFRTGLAKDLELQLGWQGPAWSKTKFAGQSVEEDGLGDVSIGLKKAIDLNDDKLSLALLAEAIIATGNDAFSNKDDIYSLSSALAYDFEKDISTSITMRYEVQNSNWAVTAVPTIEYPIAGKLSGYSEFVYHKAEGEDKEYSLGSGLVYALNDRVQFDASVAVQLEGQDKGYESGLGVSFLF